MDRNSLAQSHQHPSWRNVPAILNDGLSQERTRLGRDPTLRIVAIRTKRGDFRLIVRRECHSAPLTINLTQLSGR